MPKISVIIPVFNVEKYLERCLDSILHQTCTDFEIICVDDCSSDNSLAILKQYVMKYPQKILLKKNQKNMGPGITRNIGLQKAVGEFIVFIDSDDYIKPDYIQVYLEYMEQTKVDLIIGGYVKVHRNFKINHSVNNSIWSTLTYATIWGKMFRKDFLLRNKLEFGDFRCGEDIHFNICAFCCGIQYQVINYQGYYYMDNKTSITKSMDYRNQQEKVIIEVFDDVLNKYENNITANQREVLCYVCYVNFINVLIQFNRGCGVKLMYKKYNLCHEFMAEKFPVYINNYYLRLGMPLEQTTKIRFATSVLISFKRIHLDKIIYYLIALL